MGLEYIAVIIVLAVAVLFFASGGSVQANKPVLDVPCVFGFGSCSTPLNSSNTTPTATPTPLPYNASCFGYPLFTGGGSARAGQDCTGNGEFSDNVFCNSYPPAGAESYSANLSLYCVLGGEAQGQCCA